jgi:hypothetical protein
MVRKLLSTMNRCGAEIPVAADWGCARVRLRPLWRKRKAATVTRSNSDRGTTKSRAARRVERFGRDQARATAKAAAWVASGGGGHPTLGLEIRAGIASTGGTHGLLPFAFGESPSRYLLEIDPGAIDRLARVLAAHGMPPAMKVGTLTPSSRLVWADADLDEPVESLAERWLSPLDWN